MVGESKHIDINKSSPLPIKPFAIGGAIIVATLAVWLFLPAPAEPPPIHNNLSRPDLLNLIKTFLPDDYAGGQPPLKLSKKQKQLAQLGKSLNF